MHAPALTLAVASLAVAALPAQIRSVMWSGPLPFHSQAAINDPRSHGAIGDQWLSLAEAILLTNKQLDENALSAEEVAQLSGFGGDIAWADINAAVLPVITLERELPVIIDTPHGFTVTGSNGRPTIELGDTRGFVARSDFVDFSNLRLHGGVHGIDLVQTDTLFGTLIDRVEFDGQLVAGIRAGFLAAGLSTRLQVSACRFTNLPTAVRIDDVGDARTGRLEFFGDTRIEGCDVGVDLRLGTHGQLSLYFADVVAAGCGDAFRIQSLGTPRRDLILEGRYARIEGSRSAFSIATDPTARSLMVWQASEFRSAGAALAVGSLGSTLDFTCADSRIVGDARLAGGAGGKIALQNVVASPGTFDLGSTGGSVSITSSFLDGVALSTRGTATVAVRDSRWLGGSATGTASAPVSVEDSHRSGTQFGANVAELRPLAQPQLGRFDTTTLEPPVGTTMTLQFDLPPGLEGRVLFGLTTDFPTLLSNGARVYLSPASAALVPAPVTGTAQMPLPIPAIPSLVGLDLYFHLLVTPQPGTTAPALSLPPGRRIRIR